MLPAHAEVQKLATANNLSPSLARSTVTYTVSIGRIQDHGTRGCYPVYHDEMRDDRRRAAAFRAQRAALALSDYELNASDFTGITTANAVETTPTPRRRRRRDGYVTASKGYHTRATAPITSLGVGFEELRARYER